MKIGHIEHEISPFLVPGIKMCLLLPRTSSGQKKTRFLPGTLHFLPAGDMDGEIVRGDKKGVFTEMLAPSLYS